MFDFHRRHRAAAGEFFAVKQCHQAAVIDQPDQCNRPKRQGERRVGDLRETADHDVLRIAGDRGGRPTLEAIATASR